MSLIASKNIRRETGEETMTSGEVFLSTDTVEPALREGYWRQVMRPIAEVERADGEPVAGSPAEGHDDAGLAATLASRMCGDMLLWRASVNAQHYRRDSRTIQQSGLDQYWVQLVQAGVHAGDFNGAAARAEAGDVYVIDLAQPMSSRMDAGASVAVIMPRAELDRAAAGRNLHGALLKAGAGLTPLLADYLVGVHQVAARISARQARVVQDVLAALLATALSDTPRPSGGRAASQSAALRRRLVHYIAEHLTERELSPESLVARFRISRAHLYRVFEADGGVARFIRERRLDLAYRALADPDGKGESIKAVALRHGFSSGDRLVQAMRRRFGVSVREIRTEAGPPEGTGGDLARLHEHFARFVVRREGARGD
ncbi:helix-turn-helix domain-containing protein [Burkholderia sp. FERM BP-3421]|uniref:helix-turn-helix domain-containing protein n=1 Tax=Burkholderia sp. FERM BP-3421 TaxID=1494466 RepID=UPI00235E7599|nr:helix-turn-helix domain-containing protein [Burkholderia sp. FERM BP-3421]WDD96157.1 helix-turn-helix domain-containing protein [Burkholderia sp. FERM BP-3421]